MANTFITPSIIAKEALFQLKNNTVMANLVHRDYSNDFVAGVGDTISIRKPATFEAKEFDRTNGIEIQNANEGSVSVTMDKLLDVSFEVTAEQMTMDISDFSSQLLQPAMQSFAQKIDTYLTGLYSNVANVSGTAGTTPATLASITDVRKVLNDNKVPFASRNLVLDTAAEAKLLQLAAFTEADKVGDNGTALREASLGRKMGFDIFMDQNVKSHTTGITAATAVKVNGAVTAGATKLSVDGTSLTGKFVVGDVLTIDGKNYVVTKESAAASTNAIADVEVTPALPEIADNTAVTLTASHASNLAFHKNAFALVTRPLALPSGLGENQKAIVNYDGFGLRVIYDYNSQYKKDVISIDMLCGVKTLDPVLACRLLG